MRRFRGILFAVTAMLLVLMLSGCEHPEEDYAAAKELFISEQYSKARTAFRDLGDYENSANFVRECDYRMAMARYEAEDYEAAAIAFRAMGNYKRSAELARNCDYQLARDLYDSGNYVQAVKELTALGDYKNSREMIAAVTDMMLMEKVVGKWEYSEDNSDAIVKAVKETLAEGLGIEADAPILEQITLEPVTCSMVLTVNEDGFFTEKVKGPDTKKLEKLIREKMDQVIHAYFEREMEKEAEEMEISVEEMYEYNEVETLEELVALFKGVKMEDFVNRLYPDDLVSGLDGKTGKVGVCRISNGKLVFVTADGELKVKLDEVQPILTLTEERSDADEPVTYVYTKK